MNKQVTLYAPVKADDGRWVLQADLNLGLDTLRLSAWVSPETIEWAMRYAAKGWNWARSQTQRIGEAMGAYIELKGDWKELGPIADMVASTAYRLVQHPMLSNYDKIREGVSTFEDWKGDNGAQRQAQATALVDEIQASAAMGDPLGIERDNILRLLVEADSILGAEDSYERLSLLTSDAQNGSPQALSILQACKALGNCGCGCTKKEPIQVSVNAEALYTNGQDLRIDQIAGHCSNAQAMRAMKKYANGTVSFSDGMRMILCSVVNGQVQQDCQEVGTAIPPEPGTFFTPAENFNEVLVTPS